MKTVFVVIAVALLLAASTAVPQTLPTLTAEDIGTPLDIPELRWPLLPWVSAVSPDGQWIAYISGREMFVAPVAGGEERLLYSYDQFAEQFKDNPNFMHIININRVWSLTFTPDSREITFQVDIYDSTMGSIWEYDFIPDGQFYIGSAGNEVPYIKSMDIETGEVKDVTLGNNPDWDSTGQFLIYGSFSYSAENGQERTPVLFDTATENTQQLDLDYDSWGLPGAEFPWLFAPDGQHILFAKKTEESVLTWNGNPVQPMQVFQYALAGGEPEQVSHLTNSRRIRYPVISPDGKWLFFSSNIVSYPNTTSPNWPYELDVLDLETGECYVLVPPTSNLDIVPVGISPDGSTLYALVDDENSPPKIVSIDFDPETLGEVGQTSVEADTPTVFPTIASYPNPFNPSTTISFTLPDAGYTELAVFNLAGQKIRTLVAGEMTAGAHEAVWDGCD
ncbi:hypothetical protein ACFL5H_04255, partial [Candidatus Latescibacterota bacterium]